MLVDDAQVEPHTVVDLVESLALLGREVRRVSLEPCGQRLEPSIERREKRRESAASKCPGTTRHGSPRWSAGLSIERYPGAARADRHDAAPATRSSTCSYLLMTSDQR
jgi:hypothetical protein